MPIDFADEAASITTQFLDMQLQKHRVTTVPFSGFCLHCNEPVQERRFCDGDCRAEHERQAKLKRITGA